MIIILLYTDSRDCPWERKETSPPVLGKTSDIWMQEDFHWWIPPTYHHCLSDCLYSFSKASGEGVIFKDWKINWVKNFLYNKHALGHANTRSKVRFKYPCSQNIKNSSKEVILLNGPNLYKPQPRSWRKRQERMETFPPFLQQLFWQF